MSAEPSLTAWNLLQPITSAFLAVADAQAVGAMRTLALKLPPSETVLAGESGAAGLAGLLTMAGSRDARIQLGLDDNSRVLLINTESATDPARYAELVGITPHDVLRRVRRVEESAISLCESHPSNQGANHEH